MSEPQRDNEPGEYMTLREWVHEIINTKTFTALMFLVAGVMTVGFCVGLMWLRMR